MEERHTMQRSDVLHVPPQCAPVVTATWRAYHMVVTVLCLACFTLCVGAASTAAGVTIDGVVCTVDGVAVLRSEVNDAIGKTNPTQEEWDDACRELAIQKLIEKIAQEEGIEITAEEVDRTLAERLEAEGLEAEDVKEELERYRRYIRRYLYRRKVIPKKVKVPQIADEAKDYYEQHKEEFSVEEERRIRMISARIDKDAEPAALEAAEKKIQAALQKLKANNDFALVAREHSNGPRAADGGDWGWQKRGDFFPVLRAVVFELQVGQTSDIVRDERGFHIIKIEMRKAGSVRPFEEVEEELARKLYNERKHEKETEYLDSLIKNAVIENYDTGPPKAPPTTEEPRTTAP